MPLQMHPRLHITHDVRQVRYTLSTTTESYFLTPIVFVARIGTQNMEDFITLRCVSPT